MIDTRDLPVRVKDAVLALDHAPPAHQAGQLRVLAAYAHRFMVAAWAINDWARVVDELGLSVQWDSEGVYPGGLGILHAAWVEFGGEEFAPRGSMATPAQQILVARRLYARYGAQPWSCRATVGDGY